MRLKRLLTGGFGLALPLAMLSVMGMAAKADAKEPRTAFVHLFEWSWNEIAAECDYLGRKGYAAVQVSPPQQHVDGEAWWTRYQPMGYRLDSRSGNRREFRNMVDTCGKHGVAIYADAVINHMAAFQRNYPEAGYGYNDFHSPCGPINYRSRHSIQNCDLAALSDLKTESDYVRDRLAAYMNDLISLGVKGFRIDAAKHIPAWDIAQIKSGLNKDVFIFQEVIGAANEPVKTSEYTGNGLVTEFFYGYILGDFFKKGRPLWQLRGLGTQNGWLNSSNAIVFADNHDTQRGNAYQVMTYKDGFDRYYLANVFMLAYPYGYPKVMSSYRFGNKDQGRPFTSPQAPDGCGDQWICEHRWEGLANMVSFRNKTENHRYITNWWDNGGHQVAFGRGGDGFVVINGSQSSLVQRLQTGMAPGLYCDVANATIVDNECDGPVIEVDKQGFAEFDLAGMQASAIHIGQMADNEREVSCRWSEAYFRGTSNGWDLTPMNCEEGVWAIEQQFGRSGPYGPAGFKVSRFRNWSEAYPAQNYDIAEPGFYRIEFDDRIKQVSVIAL
jgi:alpha-amylase